MCGRYVLAQDYEELKKRFGLELSDFSMKPSYNIAPGQANPVISNGSGRTIKAMKWGLIPHWAKDPRIAYKMINARSETVAEKPSYRDAFKSKRCLIPASGFYEWQKSASDPKKKTPIHIRLKKSELFAFAGLWSLWKREDVEILTYTIITTDANEYLKEFHDRMPVILNQSDESKWLDHQTPSDELQSLLVPCAEERLEAYEVSKLVNSPENNTEECIQRVVE
ncbi:MAG: SOS response-associated peptidase [candidate division Zixibacteria bacterium]|nr:SOS response-associated peptidase [candidate division Zixibacteria bacterium]